MSDEAHRLAMPRPSQNTTEATLVEWLVAEGEHVTVGQPLYRIETEKVEMDVESPVAGTLRQIATDGGTYAVGETVGEILP